MNIKEEFRELLMEQHDTSRGKAVMSSQDIIKDALKSPDDKALRDVLYSPKAVAIEDAAKAVGKKEMLL